ncbi:MAG: stalk domain-containing protein [Firmicutes bacterium]|nr:stalk domain-containing protein [Bacillota bacterium]
MAIFGKKDKDNKESKQTSKTPAAAQSAGRSGSAATGQSAGRGGSTAPTAQPAKTVAQPAKSAAASGQTPRPAPKIGPAATGQIAKATPVAAQPVKPAQPAQSSTAQAKTISISTLSARPFVDSVKREMLPVRAVVETAGLKLDWDAATSTAKVVIPKGTVRFTMNQPLPNGLGEPMIVNNQMFLPTAYFRQVLNINVTWDRTNDALVIK